MATRQTICLWSNNAFSTSAVRYSAPVQTVFWQASEVDARVDWPTTGTFSNLKIKLVSAPGTSGSAHSYTFTLRINGVDTGVSVTISGDQTTGQSTASVAIARGDLLTISCTPANTPAAVASAGYMMAIEFVGDNTGESGYGFARATISSSANRFNGPFAGWTWLTTGLAAQNVVAASGNITHLIARVSNAPGVGTNYTFTLYKNGVKQDGSGGTVDTRVVIADAAVTNSATFSLAVVGGDTVYIECAPTGSPATTTSRCSATFTATSDGESQVCGFVTSGPSQTLTMYAVPNQFASSFSTTESDRAMISGITGFTLKGLWADLQASPGAGTSYIYTIRKNAAATGLTTTVADAATENGSSSGTVGIQSNATWSLECNPEGTTPQLRAVAWATIMDDDVPSTQQPRLTLMGMG